MIKKKNVITNLWNNLLLCTVASDLLVSVYLCVCVCACVRTWKALLGMPRARRKGGSMSASSGRFAGCHGHTEGDVSVNRRWVQ